MTWYVDLPNCYKLESAWKCLGEFETREEAIAYVKKMFGADDEGRIDLVSEVEDEDDYASEEDENLDTQPFKSSSITPSNLDS